MADKQFITADDVRQFVVDSKRPEELIVHDDDFALIYEVFRQSEKDDTGIFVRVETTKVRPKTPTAKILDVSAKSTLAALNAKRLAAEKKAQEDATAAAAVAAEAEVKP